MSMNSRVGVNNQQVARTHIGQYITAAAPSSSKPKAKYQEKKGNLLDVLSIYLLKGILP